MIIHDIIYLSLLGIGVLSLAIFYFMLGKSPGKLPDGWKKTTLPLKRFRISILFLMIYLLVNLIGEIVAINLARHGIYNSFVISINETLATPFLFGFLFIHTQTWWKRYIYALLYLVIVIYFIQGGYYHPSCVLPSFSALLFFSTYFLATLVHLTDLLVNPKSEYFKFQLKVNISILICTLLATMFTSFAWSDNNSDPFYSELFFYIHFYNIVAFHLSLDLIFLFEILKLRRG
ncbi:hypothetical protein D3C71_755890 [compost metagenome]